MHVRCVLYQRSCKHSAYVEPFKQFEEALIAIVLLNYVCYTFTLTVGAQLFPS